MWVFNYSGKIYGKINTTEYLEHTGMCSYQAHMMHYTVTSGHLDGEYESADMQTVSNHYSVGVVYYKLQAYSKLIKLNHSFTLIKCHILSVINSYL